MERLFVHASTRTRYAYAPLLQERDEFVAHLLQQGCKQRRAQSVAASLLAIIRIMELTAMRQVDAKEIALAAQRWAQDSIEHRGSGAGPTSAGRFAEVAEKWFSFHSQLVIPPAVPPSPHYELLEEFSCSLRDLKGLSKDTIKGYRLRSLLFLEWLQTERSKTIATVTVTDIDAFLAEKRLVGWKPRSLATQCQALRTFFRYAEKRLWCSPNLPKGIRSPTIPKYDTMPKGPTWHDVKRMLEPISDKPTDVKSAAILSLCAIYALRSSEVAGLKLNDFDWANETVIIRRAKRGRIQQYPIQFEVGEKLIRYLREARPHCQCMNVFVTRNQPYRPIGKTSVYAVVAKRMRSLGIEAENRGPHSLRHSCATQLLRKGSSLKDIADFLGHRDLKSVSIYAKLDVRSLRKVASFSLAGIG